MSEDDLLYHDEEQGSRGELTSVRSGPLSGVITLNVGGRKFACRRTTLQQFPDSIFAKIVSDEWVDGTSRDSEGNVFLDMDPCIFDAILQFHRELEMSEGLHDVALPCIPKSKKRYYDKLIRYVNMEDVLKVPREISDSFDTSALDLLLASCQPALSSSECLDYEVKDSKLTIHWAPQEDDPEVEVALLGSNSWGSKKLRYQLCAMFRETEEGPHVAEQKPFLRQFRVGVASKGAAVAALQQHQQQQEEKSRQLAALQQGLLVLGSPLPPPARQRQQRELAQQQQQQQQRQQQQAQQQQRRQVRLVERWRSQPLPLLHQRNRHQHEEPAAPAGPPATPTQQLPSVAQPQLPECYSYLFPEQSRWLCKQPVGVMLDCKEHDSLAVDQATGQSSEVVKTIDLPSHHDWCLYVSFKLPKIPAIAWNHSIGQTETKMLRFSVTFDLVKVKLLE